MYALAQQLFGIADNMLDMKWGNLTAAVIINMKTWRRIKPEHQKAMLLASKKIGDRFQSKNRHESDNAIDVMKNYGLTVNTPTPEQVEAWKSLIEGMAPDFRGTVIDEKAFDLLMEIKKEMDAR